MRLEKWSWIAAITAIPLGIIVWLVDRNDFIAFFKRLGSVIIAPFAVAFNWLIHPVTWPLWAVIMLGIFGFVFCAIIFWLFAKLSSEQSGTPRQLTPFEYTTDEIFGVDWLWSYRGSVFDDELTAFCPNKKCMCRLTIEGNPERISVQGTGYGRYVATPVSLNCTNCGFSRQFDSDWKTLKHKVFLEVERRIRTDEFQQRLMQNKT